MHVVSDVGRIKVYYSYTFCLSSVRSCAGVTGNNATMNSARDDSSFAVQTPSLADDQCSTHIPSLDTISALRQARDAAAAPPSLQQSTGLVAGLLELTQASNISAAIDRMRQVLALPNAVSDCVEMSRKYCRGCSQRLSFTAFIQVRMWGCMWGCLAMAAARMPHACQNIATSPHQDTAVDTQHTARLQPCLQLL